MKFTQIFSLIVATFITLAINAQNVQPEVLYQFVAANGASPYANLVQGSDGSFYGTTYRGGTNGGYGTIFNISTNGTLATLVSFAGTNGANPYAGLTLGNDGTFYGTTSGGGEYSHGTVFKLTTDRTLTTLVSFDGTNGSAPQTALTLGNDANFYGTTSWTVFKVTTNGILTNLHSFDMYDGSSPNALTLGNDACFYGTTYGGGHWNVGTAFKVTTNGTLTTLCSFDSNPCENPLGALILGSDGNFYGTTHGGLNRGSVFRVTTNGIVTALFSFTSSNYGANPYAGLTLGNDGNFYGTTRYGGTNGGYGTIFKMTTNGALTSLASFSYVNGANPQAALTLANDGTFYGTTSGGGSSGLGTVFQVMTNGTLNILASFTCADDANPQGALTLGNNGNFYGTSVYGGSNGWGAVFELTTNGAFTTVSSFNGTNGASSFAELALGNDGNFYGTTSGGGQFDYGTIFQVTTNGTLTTLVNFNSTNGAKPYAALTLGNDGNFYGTTYLGGSGGYGTVFKVTTNGILTNLFNFVRGSATLPVGGLTLANDGNFYGTTIQDDTFESYGTVFRITTNGVFKIIADFYGNIYGPSGPFGTLTLGTDGNLYGTTVVGGNYANNGTVFKMTTSGTLTLLFSFSGTNGAKPYAGLALGADGIFYGTTYEGGTNGGYGTIFKVKTNGTLTSLVSFNNANGANPYANMTLGNDRNFYGTTYYGGISGIGVIFRLGVPPAIMVQPPGNRTCLTNTTTTFSVSAVGGLPLSYQWLKNGIPLTDTGNVSGSLMANLVLSNVSATDSANYSVVITNKYGAATSSVPAILAVFAPGGSLVSSLDVRWLGFGLNTLTFLGITNTQYVLQYSTNLISSPWFNVSTNFPTSNGTWTAIDRTATNAQRFYRVIH